MPGRVEGKVAVVTAAASGIGAAVTRLLAAEGASVVIADIDGGAAEKVAAEIRESGGRALAVETDIGSPEAVRAMIDTAVNTYGRLDILHNNATARNLVARDTDCVNLDLDVWNQHLAVDLTGAMLASKFAIPTMIEGGGGSIIHTSSIAALHAQESRTAYSTSKAALLGLSAALAVQYGKHGVRSNAIAPGPIMSPRFFETADAATAQIYLEHALTPMLGEPQDIAAAALYLASDESRYVTGQLLRVDGGLTSYQAYIPSLRAAATRTTERTRS